MTAAIVPVADEAAAEAALAGRTGALVLHIVPGADDPISERLWRARVELWARDRAPALRVCAVMGPGAAEAAAYLASAPGVTGVLLATTD
jgi:hypothetical protein